MKTIWKFKLERTDRPHVTMPEESEVIHVGMQDGDITLWAIVETSSKSVCRTFAIVGTGNLFPNGEWSHIGTVFNGPFVWHIFE